MKYDKVTAVATAFAANLFLVSAGLVIMMLETAGIIAKPVTDILVILAGILAAVFIIHSAKKTVGKEEEHENDPEGHSPEGAGSLYKKDHQE